MQKSGFFNSNNGDRKYNADFFAEYFSAFIGNGVFPNPSTGLQVLTANNGYNITVKPGKAWINGYYYCNTTDYNITLSRADGMLDRIDRVVLQFNTSTRDISIKIKQGNYATVPIVKSIERNADVYELALADVYINRGATVISQGNILDLRLNKDLCGIVHGTVEQIDTTTLYNQYANKFENKINVNQQEFESWFNTIKGQLNGDLGASLNNRVTNLENTKQDKLTISSSVISTNTTQVANSYAVKQTMDRADNAYNLANTNYINNKEYLSTGVLTDFEPENGTLYMVNLGNMVQINGINSNACRDYRHFYLLLNTLNSDGLGEHIIINNGSGIVVPNKQLIIDGTNKKNNTIIEFICINNYYRPVGII